MGIDLDLYRLVYRDGCNTWDGPDTAGGRFIGSILSARRDWLEAVLTTLTRRKPAQLLAMPPR